MTRSESGEVLERFFEALVKEITVSRPEYLTDPFTVAEIYQDIVPYRSHRDLIGVEMSGDYEDALIRLLCGEGNYLLLDSTVAREEMQKELTSRNPDTGLFREFAAVDVRLNPERVPKGDGLEPRVGVEVAEADTVDPGVAATGAVEAEREAQAELGAQAGLEAQVELEAEEEPETPEDTSPRAAEVGSIRQADAAAVPGGAESVELLKPEPEDSGRDGVVGHIKTAATPPRASTEKPASDVVVSSDAEPGDPLTVCHWCREALPVGAIIRFCPFCGSDLRPSPCRECGEAMQAQWQFCVTCGADVRG